MNIYIASDHGGFNLKSSIIEKLKIANLKVETEDLGPFELHPDDDYPDYAFKLAEKVAEDNLTLYHQVVTSVQIDTGEEELRDSAIGDFKALGILICRSGNGMCIAANKVKGAYAALVVSKKHAQMARIDDNANIICLDADYLSEDPIELVKAFIETRFAGFNTRHGRRFKKIVEYENK